MIWFAALIIVVITAPIWIPIALVLGGIALALAAIVGVVLAVIAYPEIIGVVVAAIVFLWFVQWIEGRE